MSRVVATMAFAMTCTLAGGCDPAVDGELDSFRMIIDGELVEFLVDDALVAQQQQASVLALDGIVAFDDRAAKRYDDAVDLGLFAGEAGKFLFAFSLPEQPSEQLLLEDGAAAPARELFVNRTFLPRAAEPHIRFERIDDDGARTTFRPRDLQTIRVALSETNRLSLSFERLEVVDDCDNLIVLEDARIEADARASTSLQDVPRFADLGMDARQVEGRTELRLAAANLPFTELAPRAEGPRDDDARYQITLVNACATAAYHTITFAFDALTQSAPGIYDTAEIDIVAYRSRGDPDRLDDDDQWWSNSGRVEVLSSDEFFEFYAIEPLEMLHMILDGPEPVEDPTQDLILGDNSYVKAFINRSR